MVDRAGLLQAIAAQEQLRGSLPHEVVETTIAILRAQLEPVEPVRAAPERRRRQATVLFADVAGFTALSESLDPELVAGLMNELWAGVDAIIVDHRGRVDKHIGDAVLGVWGVDGAREDDPELAVRAAVALRDGFEEFRAAHGLAVDVRIGVNTGLVLFGAVGTSGEVSVTGDAVNVASRIEHAAPHGSVMISHDTYRHVRGVFDVRAREPLAVKGKSNLLRTYVVERAKPQAFRLATRGVEGIETQMIGREREQALLEEAYFESVLHGRTRLVTVIGDAGAGKSRLLDELTAWMDLRPEAVHYLKGRSVPGRQDVPRGLLRELFAFRFQIFDDDPRAVVVDKLRSGFTSLSEREADVVGHWLGFDLSHSAAVADLAGSTEFDTVAMAHLRRHLGAAAAARPVVMLLEDVHWADDESLDAVVHLVGHLESAPLLVVCLARPTFAERRPDWTDGPGSPVVIELTALSSADGARLVHDILQRADHVPRGLVELIVEQADGNPFYIEELVKMLLDDGIIVASDDGPWRIEEERLQRLTVPPTLTGVLQARLDGLADEERVALQHAAVVGRVFWDDAVASLVSDSVAEPVSQQSITPILDAVRAKELVRHNERSTFSGSLELKFKHALLREVTYETVLLDDRRRLHGVAASWLRNRAQERLSEHLGPLAEHLLNAGEHLLAAEAIEHAARNATATGAVGTAISLYRRALGLRGDVGADHTVGATRARLALVQLLQRAGEYRPAAEHVAVASADAEALGDKDLLALALVSQGSLAVDRGERELAGELLERARPAAEAAGGQVFAELLLTQAWLAHLSDDLPACVASSERALGCGRALGDGELEVRALHTMTIGNSRLGRFDEAERHLRDALAIADRIGNIAREAMLLDSLGALIHTQAGGEQGALAKAIDLYQQSVRLFEVLGATAGRIVALGNLSQAEVEGRRLDDGARHAHEYLSFAREHRLPIETGFALLVNAELAIASGDVAEGLSLIGVASADPHGDPRGDEVERILDLHGISAEQAAAGMAAGRVLSIDTVVDELLAEGPGEPAQPHPWVDRRRGATRPSPFDRLLTVNDEVVGDAATELLDMRLHRRVVPDLPLALRPHTLDEAYAIQHRVVAALTAQADGRCIGYKVACTNEIAQAALQIDRPVFGRLMSQTTSPNGTTLPADRFTHRVIEAEFAFRVGTDVEPIDGGHTQATIAAHIDALIPGIEIVDHRFESWAVGALRIVADNAIHGWWVRGEPITDWRRGDLAAAAVSVTRDGELITTGSGAAVLGHPLDVMAWLADELPTFGLQLRRGDVVTTGVATDVFEAGAGESCVADFGPFGTVTVAFD